jgi:carbon-monoxide dehydrogenase medium subunit
MEAVPGARLVAGATDLLVRIRNGELHPPALVSLRSIPELAGVETGATIRIGAMTAISDLIRSRALRDACPVLATAAGKLGSAQIRNTATVGGNLCNCSPCADTATPLLVLEARVRLQSPRRDREVPLNEFFRGPGESCLAPDEILTEILLERPGGDGGAVFFKKGRVKMDLAVASLSVRVEMEGRTCRKARVAAGSVAPVPLRLPKVEALLEGAAVSGELAAEAQRLAAESISPITDVRATEGYRRHMIGVYMKRALERLDGWSRA